MIPARNLETSDTTLMAEMGKTFMIATASSFGLMAGLTVFGIIMDKRDRLQFAKQEAKKNKKK